MSIDKCDLRHKFLTDVNWDKIKFCDGTEITFDEFLLLTPDDKGILDKINNTILLPEKVGGWNKTFVEEGLLKLLPRERTKKGMSAMTLATKICDRYNCPEKITAMKRNIERFSLNDDLERGQVFLLYVISQEIGCHMEDLIDTDNIVKLMGDFKNRAGRSNK